MFVFFANRVPAPLIPCNDNSLESLCPQLLSPLTELLTSRIDRRNFWAPVIIRNSCAKEPPRCNYTTGRQLWSNASRGSVSVGAIVITLNKPQMCSSNVF